MSGAVTQNKIDVLLINPKCWTDPPPSYLPYGILWIAGFLRSHGISVSVFDRNVDTRRTSDVILAARPSIVGLSVLTGPVIMDAIRISKDVRALAPGAKVLWGGIHTTIFPEYVLKNDYVDYVVVGEGEAPTLEIAEAILSGKRGIEAVKNAGYKVGGKMVMNPPREFIKNLDLLPDPTWDLVDIEKYAMQKFYSRRVITLNTSRGCPHRCAFCYNQAVNKRIWRGISAERLFKQVVYLSQRYGVSGFQMYDDEFDVNRERVKIFCELLIKNKVKISFAHFSRVNMADRKIYALEKEAGLKHIEFGVESGSQRILDFIRKDQTLEMIQGAFRICGELKIPASALFMTGLPTETEQDLNDTIGFLKTLKAHHTINTMFRPFPGTELFDYCVKEGLFRLPDELERQAEVFEFRASTTNVSKIPDRRLTEAHSYFVFNNMRNELLECVKHFNFALIWFYFTKKVNLGNLRYFFAGLRETVRGAGKKC